MHFALAELHLCTAKVDRQGFRLGNGMHGPILTSRPLTVQLAPCRALGPSRLTREPAATLGGVEHGGCGEA
jgi:hypothetical protein